MMKFLTVFVALLSVAFGYQATWTLNQLSEAIQNPNTDPAILPYLEHALNEMMTALYAGQQTTSVTVSIPAVDLSSWTLNEVSNALQNPDTDPALVPYLEQAINQMMEAIYAGQPVESVAVVVPAMDVSLWSLAEISAALEDPQTNPALIPYLENALNDIMTALISGQQMESIVIVAPAGLLPVESPIAPMPVVPTPVLPVGPIAPTPAETPVAPTPVETPVAPSSPLVQIIVNVNQAADAALSPVAPGPAIKPEPIIPEPVIVVQQPETVPEPVIIADGPAVPEPVIVAPVIMPEPVIVSPGIVPEPVVVAPIVLPEPVIVGTPQIPVNPVDVIAVMPQVPGEVVGPIV